MKCTARLALATLALLTITGAAYAQDIHRGYWIDTDASAIHRIGERPIVPEVYRTVMVDRSALTQVLDQAPLSTGRIDTSSETVLQLPLPDGSFERFRIEDAPIMAPELAAKYPELRTFRGQGIDHPSHTLRFDSTPKGFHGMILTPSGSIWIDPFQEQDSDHYMVYHKRDYRRGQAGAFTCGVQWDPGPGAELAGASPIHRAKGSLPSNGGTLRDYRLAVAATGEYTAFHSAGSPTVAEGMAAIVIAMNRVNGIYERDLSLTMTLVGNNDLVVYTDGSTDPYSNNSGGTMLGQNQANLDAVIGSANYDIGHVFSTGGGGIAQLRVPCTSSKARGVTGLSSPTNDVFWVDYVAHEMGHQWGGNHTFNGSSGSCSGGNRNPNTAYEPGSGSTIQAYAGICSPQNLQSNSDDYFHTISLQEMTNYSVTGNGSSCPGETATGNGVPTVDAGSTYTIPVDTPFELCGSGSDPDMDPLTFGWEQFNLGPAGHPNSPSGDAPIFRSWQPTESPCRTFPRLDDLLTGSSTLGELLPSYARTLTFRLTARDNRAVGGAYNTDQVDIEVTDQAGPFQLTSPNSGTWQGGQSQTVTWDVAGTSSAPVSCSQVDILLSTDGGQTFDQVLADNTANDGSESVIPPATPTTEARIKVMCSNNIFFDISDQDLEIEFTAEIFTDGFESGNTSAWSSAVP